ncbi:Uncharacterised protein [Corynebacterium kutscheri]|uniref:Uncharacterized protein n=1 Tax=Corynebacterium kutscheri TaxID=35755 RepID=A0A0F6R0T6_9CORY|nr:hypothetical protein [Corynebacterium kutscheri]AKE41485.1 hypothetical protein UL82_06600 [Corynebacterium kutscheri]VEH08763.1 Uncharacterised protein [Corynebacterium kutscheri]VEH09809.1 Uncharacterised protein [Corynebacterium kutscheri]VEH79892.1 Uncharacterised protein [Corynebacterium kutscheri]
MIKMRDVSTDINVLLTKKEWQKFLESIPSISDLEVSAVYGDSVNLTCEPDNMLVNQFEQYEQRPPIAEQLYRVIVHSRSDLALTEVTKKIISVLGEGSYWYGTSVEGHLDQEISAACAWTP